MNTDSVNRCRLILALPLINDAASLLKQALDAGDVACVIIVAHEMGAHEMGVNETGEREFLEHCKTLIAITRQYDVAAIVAGDTRIAGRAEADGYLIENGLDALKDAVARFSPQKIVGYGGVRERHVALEAGELNPDFMFFGALDKDIRSEPHKKNLKLANWWAQLIEIPCAVMGGNSLESAIDVAMSGAEFVILSKAVFHHEGGTGEAVIKANKYLDEFGPKFDEE
ncbi:MAG: thiamine phosphate synthase [Rhizobiaceae bacterium]|nr:thiamine phosphate synthase [Rhizobiaceae bacterium]